MSAHVLISGTLYRAPEQKTSKAGKPFVVATVRAKDGDSSQWWKLIVFSESACAELLRLSDGDAVSAQGSLRVETYDKDSQTKISLTCIADAVMALRAAPKKREKGERTAPPPPAPDRHHLDRHGGDSFDHFNDAVPF